MFGGLLQLPITVGMYFAGTLHERIAPGSKIVRTNNATNADAIAILCANAAPSVIADFYDLLAEAEGRKECA